MHIGNISILSHLLVEMPACISFLSQPTVQLRDPNPSLDAVLICQSYAGLLLATNVFCLLFLKTRGMGHFDETGVMLAGSLAIYHVLPIRRAWLKIRQGPNTQNEEATAALGGPVLHFTIHTLLLFLLVCAALQGPSSS